MKIKMTTPRTLVAELVVVVLGILLALGIDQAQTDRTNRELESAYLAALHADVESTLQWTAESGPRINADRESAALLLTEVFGGNAVIRDSVAVAQALVRLTQVPNLRVVEATMNELLATGNIRVLRNASLRNQLIAFYDMAQTFQELERDIRMRAGDATRPLIRHLDPRLVATISEHGWGTLQPWGQLTSESAPPGFRSAIARSDFVERLSRDPAVPEAISLVLNDIFAIRSRHTLLSNAARGILEALEAEISTGTI